MFLIVESKRTKVKTKRVLGMTKIFSHTIFFIFKIKKDKVKFFFCVSNKSIESIIFNIFI